jgi:vacuolar-type H+-ATPase subunit E/Vma4
VVEVRLTELLTAIEDDAATEVGRAQRAAAEQAAEIGHRAAEEAQRLRSTLLDETRRRASAQTDLELSRARTGAGQRYRAAREQLLDDLLEEARLDLDRLREADRYVAALARLLTDALAAAGRAVWVRVDPRDEALVRGLLPLGSAAEVVADLKTAGGVVVVGVGRTVDNTVERRLEAAWPALRSVVTSGWEEPLSTTGTRR